MQHPPQLQMAGSQVSGEFGGKGLALEVCRPNDAVLQSWDDKVFPGEGVGCETLRDNTFTGRHALAETFSSFLLFLILMLLLAMHASDRVRQEKRGG